MLHRIAERIIDWISGDRELDVEPANHPYYPGEALDETSPNIDTNQER